MFNNFKSCIARIKNLFIKKKFFCVECKKEKSRVHCDHCQKVTGNLFKININETVRARVSLGIEQKRDGIKKYIKKMFQGYQSSRDVKRHPDGVERYINIDREKDWYDETVQDNITKKVFRDVHEPLSHHISNTQKRGKNF